MAVVYTEGERRKQAAGKNFRRRWDLVWLHENPCSEQVNGGDGVFEVLLTAAVWADEGKVWGINKQEAGQRERRTRPRQSVPNSKCPEKVLINSCESPEKVLKKS